MKTNPRTKEVTLTQAEYVELIKKQITVSKDLDAECRKYLTEHFNVYEDDILQSKRSGMPLDTFDVIQVARHFFELGMQQSKNNNNEEKN